MHACALAVQTFLDVHELRPYGTKVQRHTLVILLELR